MLGSLASASAPLRRSARGQAACRSSAWAHGVRIGVIRVSDSGCRVRVRVRVRIRCRVRLRARVSERTSEAGFWLEAGEACCRARIVGGACKRLSFGEGVWVRVRVLRDRIRIRVIEPHPSVAGGACTADQACRSGAQGKWHRESLYTSTGRSLAAQVRLVCSADQAAYQVCSR